MAKLFSFPLNLLKTLGVIVWSVTWIVGALIVRLLTRGTTAPLAMARRPWASGILAMTGFRVEVEGAERVDWNQAHFIAANHQSFLDIPVLFFVIPVGLHFVVKSELRKIPFLSWYISAMGMVFVDRRNPESARQSIQRTAEVAISGKTIVLFPEGTRSRDGRIGPLKSGMLTAAIESSVPILPVVIEGTREGMAPGWIPRYRPRVLRVSIGRALSTLEHTAKDRRELAGSLLEELQRLRSELTGECAQSVAERSLN